ncbi:MAG TPA: PH domain-containing protein, partial [Thermoanaerobaculia bacterium]|nr:PH domain-containing protein [Thermoanaerobaculia bacterium]
MSYLERLLIPDEVVLHRAHWSLYPTFAGPVLGIVGALSAAAALSLLVPGTILFAWVLPVLPLVWLAWRYLYWVNKIYMVTNRPVLKLEGVFSKSHRDASLDKINDMHLEQGLLGRLLGYGDLGIATANEAASVTYHFLNGPVEFKRQALMSREAARPSAKPGVASSDADPVAQLERLGTLRDKG